MRKSISTAFCWFFVVGLPVTVLYLLTLATLFAFKIFGVTSVINTYNIFLLIGMFVCPVGAVLSVARPEFELARDEIPIPTLEQAPQWIILLAYKARTVVDAVYRVKIVVNNFYKRFWVIKFRIFYYLLNCVVWLYVDVQLSDFCLQETVNAVVTSSLLTLLLVVLFLLTYWVTSKNQNPST